VFHLPAIGNASLTLHNESADLYRFLEISGEVDRLKRVDHLGLIRVAFGAAHHSRWEYAVTVLNLIKHCKDVPEIHLGARISLATGTHVSSGEELLRCWALLLGIGHLAGTFATERALMFEIWRDTARRRAFLTLFPDPAVAEWVEGVMRTGRVYSFSQALGLIRLDGMAAGGSVSGPTVDLWRRILLAYSLSSSRTQIARLKLIFRNLRRLAFLSLDSHYTPAVVGLKLGQILSDPPALAKLALHDAELGTEEDELRGLEQHLYHDVYLSRPSLQAVAVREHRLRQEIRRSLRERGLKEIVEALAGNEIQGNILTEDLEAVVRLTAWTSPPLDEILLDALNIRVRQETLNRDPAVSRAGVRPIWWAAPYGREWVLQIHASPGSLPAQTSALAVGIREIVRLNDRLLARVRGALDYLDLHQFLIERFATELILATLRVIFETPVRWEWGLTSYGPRALLATRRRSREHFRRVLRNTNIPEARRTEISALRTLLMRRPDSCVVTAAANLVAYRTTEQRQLAEFDGVVVELHQDGELTATLLEVKKQRVGARADAEAQLGRSVGRLRPRAGVSVSAVESAREGRVGRAWVRLGLPPPTT
jgi:hypothetical protein